MVFNEGSRARNDNADIIRNTEGLLEKSYIIYIPNKLLFLKTL